MEGQEKHLPYRLDMRPVLVEFLWKQGQRQNLCVECVWKVIPGNRSEREERRKFHERERDRGSCFGPWACDPRNLWEGYRIIHPKNRRLEHFLKGAALCCLFSAPVYVPVCEKSFPTRCGLRIWTAEVAYSGPWDWHHLEAQSNSHVSGSETDYWTVEHNIYKGCLLWHFLVG